MLKILNKKLKRFCFKLRWPVRRRPKPKVVIRKLSKSNSKSQLDHNWPAMDHPNGQSNGGKSDKRIRLASFNAASFSMAPTVPKTENLRAFDFENGDYMKLKHQFDQSQRVKSVEEQPKSILKQSPLHPKSTENNLTRQQKFAKSKLRVSINLPYNEISLKKSALLSFSKDEKEGSSSRTEKEKSPLRSFSMSCMASGAMNGHSFSSTKTVLEVLKELNADILALQDVKAEEEKGMSPLSDLAAALGMSYVFAESWAPEFGNAILSKWPIKKWKIQKIFDDTDFRNVLKATINVPQAGELNFYCTLLDHLDENWRMKQINAIIQSNDGPHILAGGLNSLDETDYSPERWTDIVKYYEEIGKPTPKVEAMKFLKRKQYTDAKDFAGECESVVMIAKGQSVQGTCKYGTRVDYILASSESPYKFVPGSYSVFSSKGTSDHHIVKVDIVISETNVQEFVHSKRRQPKRSIVKITDSSSSKGIWK